jgi:hypothetical protein
MKKVTLLALAIIFLATGAFANGTKTLLADTAKTKKVKPAKVQYTCTMHPDVLSDKPGKCTKCGMALVKKAPGKKAEKMKM